jgi:hypothetical protein
VVLRSGKNSRTHSQQLRDELAQSYDHLRLAAAHAAGGAAEKATPTYDRARGVANRSWTTTRDAFSPLYEQMRVGAANARMERATQRTNRWPVLIGLLAAGAAAGAAGAVVARRRRAAAEWAEYEPLGGVDTGYAMSESKGSTTKRLTEGAASVADSVSAGAGKLAESLHGRSGKSAGMGDVQAAPPESGDSGITP